MATGSAQEKAVFMITHDAEEAILLGGRVIVFSRAPATVRKDVSILWPRPRDWRMRFGMRFRR